MKNVEMKCRFENTFNSEINENYCDHTDFETAAMK